MQKIGKFKTILAHLVFLLAVLRGVTPGPFNLVIGCPGAPVRDGSRRTDRNATDPIDGNASAFCAKSGRRKRTEKNHRNMIKTVDNIIIL